ncbi:helix-turn-helix domain-containing protein [Dialister invisus]|uniref:helix-turn-helix domain-containing protein n=1 Tax=Dialister invisus TaxID=218538 RepID=UPI00265A38A8|nr:helix-turn-helix transcriptional regulator [Dialister invisus]
MARLGLNRSGLSKKLGVAVLTAFQYFKPGRDLNPKTVGKIAKALEVDPSEIIKREE